MKKLPKNSLNAFTLAEVLITIIIIGIIAVMTIPTLAKNIKDKEFLEAHSVAQKRIIEAMNQMKVNDELVGYSNNAVFAVALQKYIKASQYCTSANLSPCFPAEVTDAKGKVIDLSNFITGDRITIETDKKSNYGTPIVGLTLANGIMMLIAYDKTCEWESPYGDRKDSYGNNMGSSWEMATRCLSIVYDVNGLRGPNKSGRDVGFIKAQLPSGCSVLMNGKCFTTAFQPEPLSPDECAADGYAATCTSSSRDFWAGALRTCGGKIAGASDLKVLAEEIYGTTPAIKSAGYQGGLTIKNISAALNAGLPDIQTKSIWVWSSDEVAGDKAGFRYFTKAASQYDSAVRLSSGRWAFCEQ